MRSDVSRLRVLVSIPVILYSTTLCVLPVIASAQQTSNPQPSSSSQQTSSQPSSTESKEIPSDVTDNLAIDLAKLQAGIQAAQQLASPPEPRKEIQVTSETAHVLSGASPAASKEFTAKKGEKLYVLDRANDFYAVATDNGQTGWVTAGDVKPVAEPLKTGYNTDSWEAFKGISQNSPTWQYPVAPAAAPSDNNTKQDSTGVTARIFKSLTEQAVQFRDSYKNNPYMFVSGFTVHVGIPPSVDLSFTFR